MSPGELPRLAVVYDKGAASAMEILASARKLCRVVFVCDEQLPSGAVSVAALAELADVCDITGRSDEQSAEAVRALAVDGFVTFSEMQVERTARLAAACGCPRHLPEDVVAALTDKQRQRERLREHGVQSTRCQVIRCAADVEPALAAVGLPAVIKPRRGAGSVDTCLVRTPAEGVSAYQEFTAGGEPVEFVAEELMVGDPLVAGPSFGDYVSVESIVFDGEVSTACVMGKLPFAPPFRETGMLLPATVSAELADRCAALARDAVRALGVRWGVTQSELKLTADGPRIIEVNGRLGGYVGAILRRATGFNLLRAAMQVALGIRPQLPELTFGKVTYQVFLTPPSDMTELVGIGGVDRVRALPGVWNVDLTAEPGRPTSWRAGTEAHLGVVHGEADNHRDMLETVEAIRSTIEIDYV